MRINTSSLYILTFYILAADAFSCYEKVCHECPEQVKSEKGELQDCSLRKLISEHSFDQTPLLTNYPPEKDADYACLKLTASNPDIAGDSTDVIKGCTLRMAADVMCKILSSVELARGKTNAKCVYCYGDGCNSAPKFSSTSLILLIPLIVIINKIMSF